MVLFFKMADESQKYQKSRTPFSIFPLTSFVIVYCVVIGTLTPPSAKVTVQYF